MSDDSDEQSEQPRRPITIRALGAVGALPWRQMVGAFVAVAAPLALVVAAITLTTFVPDIDDGDVVIPLAEPLSRLRDVAGVGEGYESEAAGIEEFGGDTGGFSGRAMLGGTLLFTLLGIVLGWVLFL